LRADAAMAGVAVLMLSGWAFDSDVQAGQAAGADGYLAKPFLVADLRARVQELLDRASVPSPAPHDTPAAADD